MKKKFSDGFVTGGWVTPPSEKTGGVDFITDEQYSRAAECGMDYLFTQYENPSVYGEEIVSRALERAERNGVGLFVGDYRLFDADRDRTENILSFYRKYSSFAGVNLYDEPGISLFEKLENTREKINSVFPECTCFVNLLPSYAYSTILKGTYREGDSDVATAEEYADYVNRFVSIYNPEVLSYDFYPFRAEYGKYDGNFFRQAYEIYRASKRAGVPYWTFVQITSWNPEIRETTDEEIEWQVHCSVALGAKGIMYFTYWLPFSSEAERYSGAIVERDGRNGRSFPVVKKLNSFLHSLNGPLAGAEYLGVICSGMLAEHIPEGYRVSFPDGVNAERDDRLLIGRFRKGKEDILYVVNASLTDDVGTEIGFAEDREISVFSPEGGRRVVSGRVLSLRLAKCSAVLAVVAISSEKT